MNLLSVDFDYFFKMSRDEDDLNGSYDWGHSESQTIFLDDIWTIRAAQFIRSHTSLPTTSGEENDFWDKLKIDKHAEIRYSDSHANIYDPDFLKGVLNIWNFDLHHDAYHDLDYIESEGRIGCSDWATWIIKGLCINVWQVLPYWAKYRLEDKPVVPMTRIVAGDGFGQLLPAFDKIFICRSGAWVPTWVEDKFWEFLDAVPTDVPKVCIGTCKRREYSQQDAENIAIAIQEQIDTKRGGNNQC